MDINNHFYQHLSEAITLNFQRKKIYAEMSNGKTQKLSWQLIIFEKIAQFFALYIDWRAKSFQEQNIPIIANDFVPMAPLPSPNTPPQFQQCASHKLLKQAAKITKNYRQQMNKMLAKGQFDHAAHTSYTTLCEIKALETQHQCHFAMTCHLIESIGLASLHAIDYAEMSKGETVPLSKLFIRLQTIALFNSLNLDKQAQKIHRNGIGILVNDVPSIPFVEEYKVLY